MRSISIFDVSSCRYYLDSEVHALRLSTGTRNVRLGWLLWWWIFHTGCEKDKHVTVSKQSKTWSVISSIDCGRQNMFSSRLYSIFLSRCVPQFSRPIFPNRITYLFLLHRPQVNHCDLHKLTGVLSGVYFSIWQVKLQHRYHQHKGEVAPEDCKIEVRSTIIEKSSKARKTYLVVTPVCRIKNRPWKMFDMNCSTLGAQ